MATRVLIVLDGEYRFGDGAVPAGTPDFTYNTLVNALTGAGMQVTKAHRADDSTADLQDFLFDGPGVNLLDYDVIWLIGFLGRNNTSVPPVGSSTAGGLGASQLNALANFITTASARTSADTFRAFARCAAGTDRTMPRNRST